MADPKAAELQKMIDLAASSTRHIRYLIVWASATTKEPLDAYHLGFVAQKLIALKPHLHVPRHIPELVIKAKEERAELLSIYKKHFCIPEAFEQSAVYTQSIELDEQLTEIYQVLEKAPKFVMKDWQLVAPFLKITDEQRLNPKHDTVPMLAPELWYHADDRIGIWMETKLLVNDMHAILCRISKYWEEVAEKKLPIMVAVWLTNVSLKAMRVICLSRRQFLLRMDQEFAEFWEAAVSEEPTRQLTADERLALTCQSGGGFIYAESRNNKLPFLPGVFTVQGRLNKIKRLTKENTALDPSTFVNHLQAFKRRPKGPLSAEDLKKLNDADKDLLEKVLSILSGSLQVKKAIREIEMIKEPAVQSEQMAAVLQSFFDYEKTEFVTVTDTLGEYHPAVYTNIHPPELTFGIELLLSSSRAFYWPKYNQPNKTSARLLPLAFTQTLTAEIKETMTAMRSEPSKDGRTPASIRSEALETFDATLQKFLKEKQFDLYHMTPWVAGGHVLTMLNRAFTEGIIITHELPHVRAVLHLYHAIQTSPSAVVDMPKIELFGGLCDAFKATLFGGELPSKDFEKLFRKVQNDHPFLSPYEVSDHPAHTRQVLSLVRRFYGDKHILNGLFWARAMEDPPITDPSEEQLLTAVAKAGTMHFDTCLEMIKESVLKEFAGPFPIMRLNLFAVFRLCQKFLRGYAMASGQEGIVAGTARAHSALYRIDQRMGVEKSRREPIPELEKAKTVFAVLGEECEKEEFFWDIDGLIK